ncbi:unnamed protein product [Ectocarpus sp. 4 AP-2014]
MLRLGRHSSSLKARSLRQPAVAYTRSIRPSSIRPKGLVVPSVPHNNIAPPALVRGITTNTLTNTTTTEQQRSAALFRWLQVDRRRGPHAGPAPAASVTQLQQWRGLASGSSGKGKGGEEEGGVFDRLKKTFTEEIDKNPSLKESLSKLKDAEQKLRENPSVKENLAKLKEAEKKFRENPSVQENLSKLKDAEKKWRKDAKSKQGEFVEQAEKAREKAQQGGGAFQEKFQELKQTLEEKLGKVGGESGDGKDGGEGKDGAENEFVRASKEKFSGAQKALDDNSLFSKLRVKTQAFREAVAGASSELFPSDGQKAESAVVKKLKQPKKEKKKKKKKDGKEKASVEGEEEKEEGEEEEEEEEEKGGMGSLMIVKTAGEAWERLQERLKESPIIQDLLGASRVVASGSLGQGAKAAKDTVKDKVEDVQEAWETSQHPLVYKLSSAWDSLTAESDEGIGVRELRRLDPSFSVEDWKRDIQELFLPEFMSAFLRGDVKLLKQWTGEACYNKLASEAKQRKADGMVLDPHVLDIRQGEVLAIKADAGKANPTIALQFMCQQINCVRNKKGEILEGAEDDIRATYYILAFQREFNDDEAELRWRVVDMMVVGAFPWY